jgi:hypothetical protein
MRRFPILPAVLLMVCAIHGVVEGKAGDDDFRKDKRSVFRAHGYFGYAIDSFAVDEIQYYLNPEESGETKERWVAGINFDYRINSKNKKRGWFLTGSTIHGIRSTDVDCAANPGLPVCSDYNPAEPGEQSLFIIRNSTTLEANLGVRFEFLQVHDETDHTGTWFARAQAGFVTVADSSKNLVHNHTLGVGIMITHDRFRGSYLELGGTRNELYATGSRLRYRVDGLLIWEAQPFEKDLGIHPYVRMIVEDDLGDAADSVQVYVGFSFDAARLLGKNPDP